MSQEEKTRQTVFENNTSRIEHDGVASDGMHCACIFAGAEKRQCPRHCAEDAGGLKKGAEEHTGGAIWRRSICTPEDPWQHWHQCVETSDALQVNQPALSYLNTCKRDHLVTCVTLRSARSIVRVLEAKQEVTKEFKVHSAS